MSISFLSTIHEHDNLQGRAWLAGVGNSNRYTKFNNDDLNSIGLFRKISSARLYASSICDGTCCFFKKGDYSGKFIQITNRENSGLQFDLNRFSTQQMNDATESLISVATQRQGTETRLSFRSLFLEKWNDFLDLSLRNTPVKRNGDPILTWEMWPKNISHLDPNLTYLKIHQNIKVVLDWWPDYDASITYHIYLYINGSGNLSAWVARWAYWVEGGVKSGEIGSRLRPQVINGATSLQTELDSQLRPFSVFRLTDLFYLPGNQTSRPPTGVISGFTTDDTTIVLVS
jgi:hypothetical protein